MIAKVLLWNLTFNQFSCQAYGDQDYGSLPISHGSLKGQEYKIVQKYLRLCRFCGIYVLLVKKWQTWPKGNVPFRFVNNSTRIIKVSLHLFQTEFFNSRLLDHIVKLKEKKSINAFLREINSPFRNLRERNHCQWDEVQKSTSIQLAQPDLRLS